MNKNNSIIAVSDYPNSFEELETSRINQGYLEYIDNIRWPDGFICPHCNAHSTKKRLKNRYLYLCPQCKKQVSVTSKSIFHKSRIPIKDWLIALWMIADENTEVTSRCLQRKLRLGSYNTAWVLLKKIWRIFDSSEQLPLVGDVEVTHFVIGKSNKTVIAIAANNQKQIRLNIINKLSAQSIEEFITNNVESGSEVRTVNEIVYNGIANLDYYHYIINSVQMPHLSDAKGKLKKWADSNWQSLSNNNYLNCYLNEFTFLFNNKEKKTGEIFHLLLQYALRCEPSPRGKIMNPQMSEK